MGGAGFGATFAAGTWLVIYGYAQADGPGGAMLSPRTSALLIATVVLLGFTAGCAWCVQHQCRKLQQHFDARIDQLRHQQKCDNEALIRNELTVLLPRFDAQMLHTLQRAFRYEADGLLRALDDRKFRAGLLARAVAQVPPQPGHGRVLPIRRDRED